MAGKDSRISLSIILRVVGGGTHLTRCLELLTPQVMDQPIEVLVPYDETVSGIEDLKLKFPQVSFIRVDLIQSITIQVLEKNPGIAHELYDYRTAAGICNASGEIVALLEDFGSPASDWCQQIITAHELYTYPIIGGSIEHAAQGILNWAVYLLDFGRYALPLNEGAVKHLSDVNISYKRDDLEKFRFIWETSYNEYIINGEFIRSGETLWLRPHMVVYQNRGKLHMKAVVSERYYWGRIFGRKRARQSGLLLITGYIIASPLIPILIVIRLAIIVLISHRNRAHYLYALPVIIFLAICWSVGEVAGYLHGDKYELYQ